MSCDHLKGMKAWAEEQIRLSKTPGTIILRGDLIDNGVRPLTPEGEREYWESMRELAKLTGRPIITSTQVPTIVNHFPRS